MSDLPIKRPLSPSEMPPARATHLRAHLPAPQRVIEVEETNLLLEYFRTLRRRRRAVLVMALGGALLGYLGTLAKPPLYRARTSLDIQGLNENFMNMRAVDPNAQSGNYSQESNLQTQIKLLQSESMIDRTVRRLQALPGPASQPRRDQLSQLQRDWGLPAPAPVTRKALLADVADSIRVKPVGVTRLVEVTCDSADPTLAAGFCDTLAQEFIGRDLEVRSEAAYKTGEWLTRQLAESRGNLEQAEQKLQGYAQASSMYYSPEKESVAQERLRQLQAELSRAQSDRVAKQAQFEMSTSATPDSLPMVLDSGPLKEYQMRLADLRRQDAELSSALTPDHPRVERVRAQVAELEATLKKEQTNVVGRMRNEFMAARQREALLTGDYSSQEKVVSSQVSRASQYNMLRREVDSGRQLYETMLQRAKEAGLAAAMKSSPIKIVDPARVPRQPFGPRRLFSTALGLSLGLVFGVAFAFARERVDRRLRVPGEAMHHLRVRELGVIPTARLDMTPALARRGLQPLLRGPDGEVATSHLAKRLELVTWFRRRSLLAESYRAVMSSLLFGEGQGLCRSIVVSSPGVSEGKTTLLCNLGVALAQTGRRVVLLEGDLRKPRLHEVFDLEPAPGIRDALSPANPPEAAEASLARPTLVPNLFVVPCGEGREDVSGLLHSPRLDPVLARLRAEFDVILIDSPPMLHLSDARLWGNRSDGVVLVLRAGVTTRDDAAAAQQVFEADATPLLGIILNDFEPDGASHRTYYHSYYQYEKAATASR